VVNLDFFGRSEMSGEHVPGGGDALGLQLFSQSGGIDGLYLGMPGTEGSLHAPQTLSSVGPDFQHLEGGFVAQKPFSAA
jgi:hypothetical protein